ncbi:MAG: adenosylcobinamide-phosphate synthase [Actinomycetota bacterium]|jgi:adenosylcobinamide-phosphate synthase|nr:adenosylcobinamide-phosphate synthase [Actinomycetota bacterium]
MRFHLPATGRGSGSGSGAIAAGMLLGAALDAVVGDPRRAHPVAAYGRAVGAVERRMHRDARGAGVVFTAVCVGAPVLGGVALQRASRGRPVARTVLTAAATWAVLGGTTLRREAAAMGASLERGDLTAARARLPHLAGRDPSVLDAAGLARATVESVAENTSDAVVAPLVWGALGGVPGLLGYRAVNTLDAMVGHRSPRHRRFGWASARLDDVANLVPARVTAVLTVAAAPIVGGSRRESWRIWRRDGRAHPSPNSGHCEASAAGAMGVRLGGRNVYAGRTEDRPGLGDGPPPSVADVARGARLSAAVAVGALVLTAGHVAARPMRRRLYAAARDRLAARSGGAVPSRRGGTGGAR